MSLPAAHGPADRRVRASAECLQLQAEVAGFATQHVALLKHHQLTVDAYGAQHGGGGAPPIRLAYSLVGLHLALDRGLTGEQVRAAHSRMGKPDPSWPVLVPPPDVGAVTVMTVAEAGLMLGSVRGHADAVRRWAGEAWSAWRGEHEAVARLTRRLLPDLG